MNLDLRRIPCSPNDDYRAGDDGRIYSRTRYKGFGRKEYVDWYPLIGHRDPRKGYLRITLSHENCRVTKSVHRLVCAAFHGEPSSTSMQVRHLDGNPANNVPANLQWGTQAENWTDRRAHGNGCEGEKHHSAKLSNAERSHVRWAIAKGLCSARHAARVLGMSPSSISGVLHSKT